MFGSAVNQASLFGEGEVGFDACFSSLQRFDLGDGAWLDYAPMWLQGDNTLFDTLVAVAEWTQPVVRMYDREVVTPRLVAHIEPPAHEMLTDMIETLSGRYDRLLDQLSAGWYRDGNDSVAFHGDRIARDRDEAVVATVSLGGARRFLIRPKSGGESLSFSLGHGDLVVMGGSCQRTCEHAVPKTKVAQPRIALMFRHRYD
ncbi:MAG: alpha-ketoglutarate-dependent dioxygenase AlkB [Acidimicrobiia bacterium]